MRPPLVACLCNAFDQRVRAGFGAALARVTSGPPPPSKYPASALRASAVAGRGTRPPAVKARLHPPQSFSGDRGLLLPLGQLVDFPYRLGDVVDSQQSPGFVLRDRLGLLLLVDLADFSDWTSAAPLPTMAANLLQLDLCTPHHLPAAISSPTLAPATPWPLSRCMAMQSHSANTPRPNQRGPNVCDWCKRRGLLLF